MDKLREYLKVPLAWTNIIESNFTHMRKICKEIPEVLITALIEKILISKEIFPVQAQILQRILQKQGQKTTIFEKFEKYNPSKNKKLKKFYTCQSSIKNIGEILTAISNENNNLLDLQSLAKIFKIEIWHIDNDEILIYRNHSNERIPILAIFSHDSITGILYSTMYENLFDENQCGIMVQKNESLS